MGPLVTRGGDESLFTVNRNPSHEELRKFGWAMLIGFSVLGSVSWIVYAARNEWAPLLSWTGATAQVVSACLWSLGAVLCILGVRVPGVAKPVYVTWMTLTLPIGIVMSTLMLSLVYFLLLPVFALIVRRSDPVRRRLHDGKTYWEDPSPYEQTLERMRRMF